MNITTILPIHQYNEKIEFLLTNAIKSIECQKEIESFPKVLIVCPTHVRKIVEEFLKINFKDTNLHIKLLENDVNTSFQAQINFAVNHVDTDYFSILEFDDEYSDLYFKNHSIYINAYPNIDLFLSMVVEVDEKRRKLKFTNETVWSKQFVGENGELGFLNIKSLNQYTDFKICGGVFKKEEFLGCGGLKTNIELSFQYELLLRMLNNGSKIYTIPKVCYMHNATREDSLFAKYMKNMSMGERKFWFETAKKEYSFFNDREIDKSTLKKETDKPMVPMVVKEE
jgi:hypothetical protein